MGKKFVHWLLGDDPRKWLEPVKSSNPDEIPTFHVELVDKFGKKFHNGIPPGQLPEPDDKLYVITKEPFHQIMVLDKKGGEHWFINNYNWTKRENKHEKEFVLSRMTASDMFRESEKAGELRIKDAIARGKGEEPKPHVRKNIRVVGRQKFPRICVIGLDGVDMWVDTTADDPDLLLVARKHKAIMKRVEEFMAKMTVDELGEYTKKWEKHMEKHGVAIVTKEDMDKVKVKTSAKANTPVKTEGSQRESAEQRAVNALANAIVHSQPAGKVLVKTPAQPEHQHKEKEPARAKTPVPGHQQMEKKKVAAKPQASPAPPPVPPKIPLDQPDGAQNGKRVARIDPSVVSPEPRAIKPKKGTMMVPMNQPVPTRAVSPLPRSSTPYPAEETFDDDHMANALSLNRSTPTPRPVSAGGPPQAPVYGSVYQPQPQYPGAQAAVYQALYNPHAQQQIAQAAVYQALYRQPTPQQQLPVGARHDRAVTPLPAPQPIRPFPARAVSETHFLNPDRTPVSQPSTQRMTGNPEWKNDTNRATGGGRAKTPQPTTSLNIPSIKVSSPSSPRQKSPAPATRKPAPARSPSPAPPARDDRQTLPSQKAKASPSSSGQTQKTKPAQQQPAQPTVQKPVQKKQQPAQQPVQQEKPALKVVTQQQAVSQQKPAQKPLQAQQQKAVQQPAQQQKVLQAQQKNPAQVQQKPAAAQQKTTAQVQQTPVQQQKKPVQTPAQQPAQQQKTATQVQQKPVEKKTVQQQPVKQSVQQPVQQQKTACPAQQKPVEKKPIQQQKPAAQGQQKPVEKKTVQQQPVQQKPVEKKPVQQQKAASTAQQKPVEKKPAQQQKAAAPAQEKPVEKKPVPQKPAQKPAQPAQSVEQQKATPQSQQKPVEKKPVQPAQQQKTTSQSQQKPAEKKPVQQPVQQKPTQKPAQPAQQQKTASQGQQQSSPATVVRKPAPAPSPAPTAASVKKTSDAGPRKPVPGAVPSPSPSVISSAPSSPGPRLPRAPRPPGWDQIPTWNGPNGSRANSVAGGSEVGSVPPAAPPSMRQSSSASRASMLSAAITAAVSAAVNAVAGATGGYGDDMNSANPNEYQQHGGQNPQYQRQGHVQGDPYQGGHMPGSWAFSPTVGNAEMAAGRFPNQQQQRTPAGAGHVCDEDCRRSGFPAVVGDNAAFMFGTGYRPRDSRDPRAPR